MSVRFLFRRYMTAAFMSTTIMLSAVATTTALAQDQIRPDQQSDQESQKAPRERQTVKEPDERADDEAPALGVLTGSCPGKAVCVKGTLPHSPADEAGIEPGDYILSVDGDQVTSPSTLKKLIAGKKPESEVTLMVWRQGEERECKVQLAAKADKLPSSHDAWLGVMLASNENEVVIDHIVPGSPASESELEEGDKVIKVNRDELKDAESFIGKIENMAPGDELRLTIRRDEEEHEVTVKLGSFGDAPLAFIRQLTSESDSFEGNHASDATALHLMERALDDVRKQIRELRNEVRTLQNDRETGSSSSQPDDQKQDQQQKGNRRNAPAEKDVSITTAINPLLLVAQVGYRGPRGGNVYRNNGYGNNYRNNYGYNPYRSYYGGNFNRGVNPYSRYNYPAPLGNNYYYRYGGRPYYYGGNNSWYGNRPRSGIQVGPNIGVYWY